MVKTTQLIQHDTVRDAIDAMHRKVAVAANSKRATAVERKKRYTNVTAVNFDSGNFVLIGCFQQQKQSELSVTWTMSSKAITVPLVVKIQSLVDNKVRSSASLAWKFYHLAALNLTE